MLAKRSEGAAVSAGAATVFSAFSLWIFALAVRKRGIEQCREAGNVDTVYMPKKKESSKKIAINRDFMVRMYQVLRILVPSICSPEVAYAGLVATLLVARTSFDIIIMTINTAIERSIVSRNTNDFLYNLRRFVLVMIPVSCVNGLLKYGHSEMKMRFRTRMTKYLYSQYLKGFTYYKVSNLDNRIGNADQLLTQDVERLCNSVVDLYSNITKPSLDICIYAVKLAGAIGVRGPAVMLSYLFGSGLILTWLRQPTSIFTVAEQKLEGNFRYMNSRLITHSEEIAFYHGNAREESVLSRSFDRLINLIRKAQQFRFSMAIVDNLVAKYFATIVGYYVVSRPFLNLDHPRHLNSSHAEVMEDYLKSGRMMVRLSEAMGRLVLSGRELTRLAGFTSRITDFIGVLKDLNNGVYKRTMMVKEDSEDEKKSVTSNQMVPGAGKILYKSSVISFKDVPLVTPNGDVLIESMNFTVRSGMNVLVTGPNGCGKSSCFRVLGELWPLFGGELTKPARENLFYVPQKPYLTLGTLRDQIIYPHDVKDMREKSDRTDSELAQFLDLVSLSYLLDREGGFDAVHDWADVLSGGEKQRIAMARLFYHAPQFAILDECTSAVSVDVEGAMYAHCRAQNISLFTISHHNDILMQYHDHILKFDGRGGHRFYRITEDSE